VVSETEIYEFLMGIGVQSARSGSISREEGEDIASETYLKLATSKYGVALVSWKALARKAFERAKIDYFRRRSLERATCQEALTKNKQDIEPDWNIMLEKCLEVLPENFRDVFLLDYCEFDAKEGSAHIGLSVPAYKSRLYRAKTVIKTVLFNG